MSQSLSELPQIKARQRWGTILVTGFIILALSVLFAIISYRILVKPRGNAFDYYVIWYGSRVFWLKQNAYSLDTARTIQQAVFGTKVAAGGNQQGFAYPATIAVILGPLLLLPFPISASIWLSLQFIGIGVAAVLAIYVLRIRPKPLQFALLILGAYLFRYPLIAYVIGQTSVFVWVSLAIAIALAYSQRYFWAGVALSLTCIRPELGSVLSLIFIVLCFQQSRIPILKGLIAGLVIPLGITLIWNPQWPLDFTQGVRAYAGYAPVRWAPTLYPPFGWLAVCLVLSATAYSIRHSWQTSNRLQIGLAAAIPLLLILIPQTGSYSFTLTLIPLYTALRPKVPLIGRLLAASLFFIPWVVWYFVQNHIAPFPIENLWIPTQAAAALAVSMIPRTTSNLNAVKSPEGPATI